MDSESYSKYNVFSFSIIVQTYSTLSRFLQKFTKVYKNGGYGVAGMVGSQKMSSIPVTMLLKKVCANFGGDWVQHHEMAVLE